MRVLVIEDDESFRGLTVRWLQSCGIEAEGVADGGRALALYRKRPADVIITDMFMPEVEGFETISGLRREFPEAKIIAMSGRSPKAKYDVLQAARQIGAARTFKKPFRFEELVAAVRELGEASHRQVPRL